MAARPFPVPVVDSPARCAGERCCNGAPMPRSAPWPRQACNPGTDDFTCRSALAKFQCKADASPSSGVVI